MLILENTYREISNQIQEWEPNSSDLEKTLRVIQNTDPYNASEMFWTLQHCQRALTLTLSWIQIDSDIWISLLNGYDPLREKKTLWSFGEEQNTNIANHFVASNKKWPGGSNTLQTTHSGKGIAEKIYSSLINSWRPIDAIDIDQPLFQIAISNIAGERWRQVMKKMRANKIENEKVITLREDYNFKNINLETKTFLNQYLRIWWDRKTTGDLFYTLTVLPTKENAELEGMMFEDFKTLFGESIDQPWDAIQQANENVISILDKWTSVQIYNDDGTNLKFSVKDMTFANSVIQKNIPWSEIFSAPIIDSMSGVLVSKGKFSYNNSWIIEDIVLHIKNGEIIKCSAKHWEKELKEIVFWIKNMNKFWEFWIWTNPHLQRQFLHWLLVEKVSWSFHLALWESYSYKFYDGKKVNLYNWNDTDNHHRDITTILRWKKSGIYIDGTMIQKNWLRVVPWTEVLNKWWGHIKKELQPHRWKEKYPHGYM
jgi:leucyl aminopeptidase (aminopeptidase T)